MVLPHAPPQQGVTPKATVSGFPLSTPEITSRAIPIARDDGDHGDGLIFNFFDYLPLGDTILIEIEIEIHFQDWGLPGCSLPWW